LFIRKEGCTIHSSHTLPNLQIFALDFGEIRLRGLKAQRKYYFRDYYSLRQREFRLLSLYLFRCSNRNHFHYLDRALYPLPLDLSKEFQELAVSLVGAQRYSSRWFRRNNKVGRLTLLSAQNPLSLFTTGAMPIFLYHLSRRLNVKL